MVLKIFQRINTLLYNLLGSKISTKLAMSPLGKLIFALFFKGKGKRIYTIYGGVKLELSPIDAMYSGIGILGSYNRFETDFLQSTILPGAVVIDVGAYIGAYSILLSKLVGEKGKVYAFEPSPAHRKRLKENMLLNKVSKNIRIVNIAASNKKGTALFYEAGSGSSLSQEEAEFHIGYKIKPYPVATITLNEFVKREKIKQVHFLKVDAEGWDFQVLQGASEILKGENAPDVIVEIIDAQLKKAGSSAKEILAYMRGMGYTVYKFSNRGIGFYTDTDQTLNLLFKK